MADHFSNGLRLTAPAASQCGRTFSRWLVEWLTQICGWSVHDQVSGNWTNYVAQGTIGSVDATDPHRFCINSETFSFTTSDVGAYLTLTGFSAYRSRFASRDGIYRIKSVVSSDTVDLDVERSVHEDGLPLGAGSISWSLWRPTTSYVPDQSNVIVLKGSGTAGAGYDFHLHIAVRSSNSYFPEFRISPFASWNNVSHAWSDSKYTSAKGIDNWNNSVINVDSMRVWGAADADRAVLMLRMEDDYYAWHFIYLGEIDVLDEALDPRPCMIWTGSNRGNSTPGDDNNTLVGTGYDSSVIDGGRWLANDNLTTATVYFVFAHCAGSTDTNWISDTQRVWNELLRRRHRQSILCECRTSGYMEMRGTLRRVWVSGRDIPRMFLFGTNGELLHTVGGITIPWLNSKVWYERG